MNTKDLKKIIRRIIDVKTKRIKFPANFDKKAGDTVCKSMCSALLQPEVHQRLGYLKGGANDVKVHPYFSSIDWDSISKRQTPAIWKPDAAMLKKNTSVQSEDLEEDQTLYTGDGSAFKDWGELQIGVNFRLG